jgi:RimJ/RimL family protein N-acetyltransferase
MTPTLPADTEHLRFRPMGTEDVDELLVLYEDPQVARFLGIYDRAWFERYIGIVADEWAERGHGRVAVVERESGRFVGRSGLKHWPQFDETEVVWTLHADARGRGYATEAGTASLRWGFEQFGLPFIAANIQPANTASIRVAERLGMKPIRSDRLLGEEVTVYAISREEWAARSPR